MQMWGYLVKGLLRVSLPTFQNYFILKFAGSYDVPLPTAREKDYNQYTHKIYTLRLSPRISEVKRQVLASKPKNSEVIRESVPQGSLRYI